jgi:hypothetical protein
MSIVLENSVLRISVLCPLKPLWFDICSVDEEDSHVLVIKPTICTNFSNLFLE